MLDDDYDVGMDSNEMYDENIAPEIKNDIIQDLTFVMILKNYNKKVKIDNLKDMMLQNFTVQLLIKIVLNQIKHLVTSANDELWQIAK